LLKASFKINRESSRNAAPTNQELDYIARLQDQGSRWEDLGYTREFRRDGHVPTGRKIWLCYEIDSRRDKDSIAKDCGGVSNIDLDVDQVRAVCRRREGEATCVPGVDVGADGAE